VAVQIAYSRAFPDTYGLKGAPALEVYMAFIAAVRYLSRPFAARRNDVAGQLRHN
jgi:hypothetical protein